MRKFCATVMFLLLPSIASAQIAMTRTRIPTNFVAITAGSGAIASTASGDDATQDAIPIGFTFNYLGTNYTSISASTNGWISFVASAGAFSRDNFALFTATTPNITIAPWWDDLATTSTPDTAHLQYQTSGTAGARVFTMQWTTLSYSSSTTRVLRFQVKLYEASNVIEMHYDPTLGAGVVATAESASIGLENSGVFLDAVTGASTFGFGFMSPEKWPTQGFRFTPGAPVAIATGLYSVGNGGDFSNLSEAIAAVNQRGIDGLVSLDLTDTLYDMTPAGGSNVFPLAIGPIAATAGSELSIQSASARAVIQYAGASAGFITANANPSLIDATTEPLFLLLGADSVFLYKVELTSGSNTRLDRGIVLSNVSSTDGATFNTFQDVKIRLALDNNSIAIDQNLLITPGAASGANSQNEYYDLDIAQAAHGIRLRGNSTNPDFDTLISTALPTARNSIGSVTSPGLRQANGSSTGIDANNQRGLIVERTDIRNVVCGADPCAAIVLSNSRSSARVSHNRILGVRNEVASSNDPADGIRATNADGGGQTQISNNFVAGISHAYTGAGTTSRLIRGIVAQPGGGGASNQSFAIDHNSVSIDASLSPNASSTAVDIGSSTGPVVRLRNNVLANFTAAQAAPAAHYIIATTSATQIGNTGSISNNNDLYIANATRGFIGIGNTTQYSLLNDWQTATAADFASTSVNPGFVDTQTDLHASNPALVNAGLTGTGASNDIDRESRSTPPDIGADEFLPPIDIFKNSFE